jgi:phosphate transport system substrate-binding protein
MKPSETLLVRASRTPSLPSARSSVVLLLCSLAVSLGLASSSRAEDALGDTGVKGAGSTLAYPLLSQWSRAYRESTARGGAYPVPSAGLDDAQPGTALEYEAVGSLAGTQRIRQRAVDFGASDLPLSAAELNAAGLAQFPFVIGGVVIAVNIPGVRGSELQLTGPVLADIFLGKVTSWSDPSIRAINPGVQLPDAAIRVVHRSDGSGTTYNLSEYLSRVSPDWQAKLGSGLLIQWPTGAAAKGNEGVGKAVLATPHAIGYVDLAQATQLGLERASLQNRAGHFVQPSAASFRAAAGGVDGSAASAWGSSLIDQPGLDAYPITATVYALMPKEPRLRSHAALEFFRYALEHGDATASQLGYVPLPQALVAQVERYWRASFR